MKIYVQPRSIQSLPNGQTGKRLYQQLTAPLVVVGLCVALLGCGSLTRQIEQDPPDAAVSKTEVKAALIAAPDIDAASILVELIDGEITLSGFVDSLSSKASALKIAQSMSRKKVKDQLKVKN